MTPAATPSPVPASNLPQIERYLWYNRWSRIAIGIGVAALSGLLVAMTMPRGPATAAQALMVLALGLGVGLAAGYFMHSRWAMLIAPAAHIAAIELARLPVVGPTGEPAR